MTSVDDWFIRHIVVVDDFSDRKEPFCAIMHEVLHAQDCKMYTCHAVNEPVVERLGHADQVVESEKNSRMACAACTSVLKEAAFQVDHHVQMVASTAHRVDVGRDQVEEGEFLLLCRDEFIETDIRAAVVLTVACMEELTKEVPSSVRCCKVRLGEAVFLLFLESKLVDR